MCLHAFSASTTSAATVLRQRAASAGTPLSGLLVAGDKALLRKALIKVFRARRCCPVYTRHTRRWKASLRDSETTAEETCTVSGRVAGQWPSLKPP
jgi:hypothetical protein